MNIGNLKFQPEDNRYMIVEYLDSIEVIMDKDDYNNFLDDLRKSNKSKMSTIISGNVSVVHIGKRSIKAKYHRYHMLTPKTTISSLDDFTVQFDEEGLERVLKDRIITSNDFYPDINIAYFEDKNKKLKTENDVDRRILYLPIVYINDIKYLDIKYIKRCLVYHSDNKDIDFFKALAYRFELYLSCMEEIESLYEAIEKVEYKNANSDLLYYASLKLLNKLIYERDKNDSLIRLDDGAYQLSKRRLRDFGMFMKYYNCSIKNSPLEYNGHLIKNKIEMQEYEHRFENMEDSFNEYNAYNSWDDGCTFKLKK